MLGLEGYQIAELGVKRPAQLRRLGKGIVLEVPPKPWIKCHGGGEGEGAADRETGSVVTAIRKGTKL